MHRLSALLMLAVLLVAGCAAKGGKGNEAFRDELRAALRDDPSIFIEAVRENRSEVIRILAEDWRQDLAGPLKPQIFADRPMLGAPDASVTIVAYSDFLCGYCARGAVTVAKLLERHPGTLRFTFKHFPMHPLSVPLAETFEALSLRDQAKAWQFHDLAFANMKQIEAGGEPVIAAILKEMKVNVAQVAKDRKDPRVAKRLSLDRAEVLSFGLDGTPTFIVNGMRIDGALPIEEFEVAIRMAEEDAVKQGK